MDTIEQYKEELDLLSQSIFYKMWNKINRDIREKIKLDLYMKDSSLSYKFREYIQDFTISHTSISGVSFPRTKLHWESIFENTHSF